MSMDTAVNGLVARMAGALRESGLHRNVADGFVERAQIEGAKRAADTLFMDGHHPSVLAQCFADTFGLVVFSGDTHSIAERGPGWLLGDSGVLFMRNFFDQSLRDQLTAKYNEAITDWGVLPDIHHAADDADTLTTEEVRANDAALDQILLDALRRDSSDIHMRVMGTEARVRIRVDGRLMDVQTLKLQDSYPKIVNRILSRCGKTPGAYISPVSGQFQFDLPQRVIPVRVELLPTRVAGEVHPNVTLRLMGTSSDLKELNSLGFPDSAINPQLTRIRAMTRRPNGLILVTGPTGSGKTTSLYAMMGKMLREAPDRAYYTLEDPQEIELPGADQVQINPEAGLTFATGLRSLMRKDPDVILVGEIRDKETMDQAVRASLTGHLVLSTLHTNSAVASVMRLVEMGCDPTLIANTVVGILAQRVLRRVCPECANRLTWRQMYTLDHPALTGLPEELAQRYQSAEYAYRDLAACPADEDVVLLAGAGCANCGNKGYKGRCIITETLSLDSRLRELISRHERHSELVQYAAQSAFVEMWGHALARIGAQEITLDEALDVLEERECAGTLRINRGQDAPRNQTGLPVADKALAVGGGVR